MIGPGSPEMLSLPFGLAVPRLLVCDSIVFLHLAKLIVDAPLQDVRFGHAHFAFGAHRASKPFNALNRFIV